MYGKLWKIIWNSRATNIKALDVMAEDIACQELVELVSDYLERALPESLRASVEEHIEICPDCEIYLGQMRLTIRSLRSLAEATPSHSQRERLLRQFREWKAASSR